jgi:putrescine---pyruvate transaminase
LLSFCELREHPLVGDAETCGLMGALLLVKDKTGHALPARVEIGMVCRGHCFANGLIMRAVGDRMIIAPPLVITRTQIDEMMALIRRCLDLTLADARRPAGWHRLPPLPRLAPFFRWPPSSAPSSAPRPHRSAASGGSS